MRLSVLLVPEIPIKHYTLYNKCILIMGEFKIFYIAIKDGQCGI